MKIAIPQAEDVSPLLRTFIVQVCLRRSGSREVTFSTSKDVLAHGRGADLGEVQERRHAPEHTVHVQGELKDVTCAVEQKRVRDMSGGRPCLLDDAFEWGCVGGKGLQDHVTDVAGAGLHSL